MHKLLFFFFSVDELGAIFIFSKIHPKVINIFPWIFPFRYFVGVIMLLGFYIACSWCVFLCVYWCILIICVNFVFLPCLVVSCLHCFCMWRHPWYCRLTGHLIIVFLWHNLSVHYENLMISYTVPIQCIIIIHFEMIYPHILWYHNCPRCCETMFTHFLFTVGLVRHWNLWNPFKNKVSLGHLWMIFLCRILIYPIYYLLGPC